MIMGWSETQAAVRIGRRVSQKRINADQAFWDASLKARLSCTLKAEIGGGPTVEFPERYIQEALGLNSPLAHDNYWDAERCWKICCIRLIIYLYAGIKIDYDYIEARLPKTPYTFNIETRAIKILSHQLRKVD